MRKSYRVFLTFTLIGAAALAACSSSGTLHQNRSLAAFEGDSRLGPQTDRLCFQRNIDSFYNNERDTVVVSTGGTHDYLLEMSGICSNLRNAQSVAVDSATSCLTPGDSLIVSESAFSLSDSGGIGAERCMIASIHRWDRRANKAPS